MADNEIRLNVTAVESEPLNVCVKQVPMNPVNVENTYKGLDYNLLKNRPSIDGGILEGDKTTAEVIGFDKEYVDDAILATNAKIDEISAREGYSKEEIDNKVIVIEADIDAQADAIQKTRSDFMESDSELQQQINAHAEELTTHRNDIDELGDQVAGIESKIPEGTSDTNPLINKQQLLDEEMDIRSDFNESVSELQTQITAQASAIANKVDATGDTMTGALNLPELNVATSEGTLNLSITAGVATIATNNGLDIVSQTKFDTAPTTDDSTTWADALDTALVRKAQVATAIAEAGGGGSVPDNVYTEDNLIGGKDIEIVKKSGGIDENTLACWNFDKDTKDEVNGLVFESYTDYAEVSTEYQCLGEGVGNLYHNSGSWTFNVEENADWTIEGFFMLPDTKGCYLGRGDYYSSTERLSQYYLRFDTNKIRIYDYQTELAVYEKDFGTYNWVHLALQSKSGKIQAFCDGVKVMEVDAPSGGFSGGKFAVTSKYLGRFYADAVRISNVARYDGDFEPPTVPYEAGSAGSVINFTGQSGKNIGEVYYSQSSLASDNAGALPLFTGETITSADTIYPDFYSWVESHTELQATAEEYETALSTYGECPKYVVSNGSLRLPKLANYIKMANTTDGVTQREAGLPNITGSLAVGYGVGDQVSEAFYKTSISTNINSGTSGTSYRAGFDASLSSEVYGKSDTVTPAHTTLYPWVFVYNASVPASTAQAAEFQEGLSGKADANLGNIPTNYDYVVESYNDGTNWYRVYKSGWLEQGGTTDIGNDGEYFINFPKPFANTQYNILKTNHFYLNVAGNFPYFDIWGKTTTSATTYNARQSTGGVGFSWYACGQGE